MAKGPITTGMEMPVPVPTPDTLPFWEGAAQGELRMQRCTHCDKLYFYPRPYCPMCWTDEVVWEALSGRGTVASFTIDFRPLPLWKSNEPRIIALIQLEEGPRMASNIIGIAPEPSLIPIGAPVEVTFEACGDQWLPKFQLTEAN